MDTIHTKLTPIAEHRLDVGRFVYYPNFVIGEFNEGVIATFETALVPIQLALDIYGNDKPIVYISHRLHSYTVDPVGYKEFYDLFPNFEGFAIVATNKRRRMLAQLEKLFVKKPIRVFSDLDGAMLWAEEIIEKLS